MKTKRTEFTVNQQLAREYRMGFLQSRVHAFRQGLYKSTLGPYIPRLNPYIARPYRPLSCSPEYPGYLQRPSSQSGHYRTFSCRPQDRILLNYNGTKARTKLFLHNGSEHTHFNIVIRD